MRNVELMVCIPDNQSPSRKAKWEFLRPSLWAVRRRRRVWMEPLSNRPTRGEMECSNLGAFLCLYEQDRSQRCEDRHLNIRNRGDGGRQNCHSDVCLRPNEKRTNTGWKRTTTIRTEFPLKGMNEFVKVDGRRQRKTSKQDGSVFLHCMSTRERYSSIESISEIVCKTTNSMKQQTHDDFRARPCSAEPR